MFSRLVVFGKHCRETMCPQLCPGLKDCFSELPRVIFAEAEKCAQVRVNFIYGDGMLTPNHWVVMGYLLFKGPRGNRTPNFSLIHLTNYGQFCSVVNIQKKFCFAVFFVSMPFHRFGFTHMSTSFQLVDCVEVIYFLRL